MLAVRQRKENENINLDYCVETTRPQCPISGVGRRQIREFRDEKVALLRVVALNTTI